MKICTGYSVGVIPVNYAGEVLVFERPDGKGVAPVAGHVFDEQPTYEDAAIAETREEVGVPITADDLVPVAEGQRNRDRCKRLPSPRPDPGHYWRVYRVDGFPTQVTGSERETRFLRWVPPFTLERLMMRTVAFAKGQVRPVEWLSEPGLEPVWALWLHKADLINVSRAYLDLLETCSTAGLK